jgi:hypothetical protein
VAPVGERVGTTEVVALGVRDAQVAQGDQFGFGLDLFRDDGRPHLAGEGDQRGDHGPFPGRDVEVADQRAVDLEQVRFETQDVVQPGEPGADVVDGDAQAERGETVQDAPQRRVVLDGRVFGDLDDDPARRRLGQGVGDRRVQQAVRGEVDRDVGRIGLVHRRGCPQSELDHLAFEFDPHAQRPGVREHLGRPLVERREAGEELVADHPPVGHRHERLRHQDQVVPGFQVRETAASVQTGAARQLDPFALSATIAASRRTRSSSRSDRCSRIRRLNPQNVP